MSTKPTILVAEDEGALITLLRYNLERENYRVLEAQDGEEALLVAAEEKPDLVLLDWMLPQLSGIEVCRRLRGRQETRNVPIIMLTARGEESDRIRGLDTGADDYLTKPFSMTELLARLRAVLRRIRPSLAEDVIAVGDIEMDRAAHRVRRAGTEVHLGPTEYRLLDHLIQHPGRVSVVTFCALPPSRSNIDVVSLRKKTWLADAVRVPHPARRRPTQGQSHGNREPVSRSYAYGS